MKHFLDNSESGAWPFLVGEVICLVDSDNERGLHLSIAGALVLVGCTQPSGPLQMAMRPESGMKLLSGVEHYVTNQVLISRSRQQVCDALRCSGPHAHDNDVLNPCLSEGLALARSLRESSLLQGFVRGVGLVRTPVLKLEWGIPEVHTVSGIGDCNCSP